ncbi:flagellar export chaperone FlgN [Actinomadura hibisca]|uniref:flagellar export chaperone FlgN n=1 Tax=Actinomadura hibisca TaxID=68565 RepID=UPI00083781F9|nr:flagellar export chaperone FlgN [Actinomadura hibisca]
MSLADLSSTLWRVRELLDLLLFKLEEEQLLLTAGKTRWLPHATREVELVLEQVRQSEMLRATLVEAVAEELGLPPAPSIGRLAEAAGAPWSEILQQHRAAFLTVTSEITAAAETNRELLTTGARAVHEALLGITDQVATYSRTGATVGAGRGSRLVNEAM